MKNKVTLYIATHNKTGLRYFGKTTRYFTVQELQENYHGSGVHWNNHLKIHGDDVTMEIYKICSLNEDEQDYVKPIALKFSEENNIVNDYHNWANQIPEDGLAGGGLTVDQLTEEQRKRLSDAKVGVNNPMYGKKLSSSHREKIGNSNRGKKRSEEFSEKQRNRKGEKRSAETCANISKSKSGEKNPLFGKKLSEEHKKKIGEANSIALTGRKLSEEHKNSISEALKGHSVSEETKLKLKNKFKERPILICPYCNKEGRGGAMVQWHFDNCKFKGSLNGFN